MTLFAIIIESDKTDDVIRIYKTCDTHYRIEYVSERAVGASTGGRMYSRTEANVDRIAQYLNDVFDLINIDNTPPKFIHLHADGYPNTVITRENISTARSTVLRTLKNVLTA